jgi:hypothetical protein
MSSKLVVLINKDIMKKNVLMIVNPVSGGIDKTTLLSEAQQFSR